MNLVLISICYQRVVLCAYNRKPSRVAVVINYLIVMIIISMLTLSSKRDVFLNFDLMIINKLTVKLAYAIESGITLIN